MRFLSNPSLMPNLPQPDRWTDAEAERLYLHAARLAFLRPDGVRVEIEAGRPAGFGVE